MQILRNKMRKIFRISIVVWIGILLPLVYAQDENAAQDDATATNEYLYATTAVRMRSEPNVKSKQIGLLRETEEVKVLEPIGERIRIGSDWGQWQKVEYKGNTGYVFDAFFVKSKPPNFSEYETSVNLSKHVGSYGQYSEPSNEPATCRPNLLLIEKRLIIVKGQCSVDDDSFCLVKSREGDLFTCYEDYVLDDYYFEKYWLSKSMKEKGAREIIVKFSGKSVFVNNQKFVK